MTYEVIPRDLESESDLTLSMWGEITINGNDNLTNPYNPNASLEDIEQSYSPNGHLGFGALWMTHHRRVGNHELIYAYRPPVIFKADAAHKFLAKMAGEEPLKDGGKPIPSVGEFYIHTYNDEGIKSRTQFSEHEGEVYKKRITNFGANFGFGITELSRPTNSEDEEALRFVIIAPESNVIALDGLTKLAKKEKKDAEKVRQEYKKRMQGHRETLDDIARCVTIIK